MSYTFFGGVKLDRSFSAADFQITPMTPPQMLFIPLSVGDKLQCEPCVKAGDFVCIGDIIATPIDENGCQIHSSVSGEVIAIDTIADIYNDTVKAVIIRNDGNDTLSENIVGFDGTISDLTPEIIINRVKDAGIVISNSEVCPLFLVLQKLDGKCRRLVIDCTDSYPRVSSGRRIVKDNAYELINGTKILMKSLGVRSACFVFANDQKSDIRELRKANFDGDMFSICTVEKKYPQSDPRLMVSALTRREFATFDDMMNAGYAVFEPSSCLDVFNAIVHGMPMIDRVVSVTGAIGENMNIIVPIGTIMADIIDFCQGRTYQNCLVVASGVMNGKSCDPSAPLDKTTRAVTVIKSDEIDNREREITLEEMNDPKTKFRFNCIGCGECVACCPMRLMPNVLAENVANKKRESFVKLHIEMCSDCGICTYLCPSDDPLSFIRIGKELLKQSDDNAVNDNTDISENTENTDNNGDGGEEQ